MSYCFKLVKVQEICFSYLFFNFLVISILRWNWGVGDVRKRERGKVWIGYLIKMCKFYCFRRMVCYNGYKILINWIIGEDLIFFFIKGINQGCFYDSCGIVKWLEGFS